MYFHQSWVASSPLCDQVLVEIKYICTYFLPISHQYYHVKVVYFAGLSRVTGLGTTVIEKEGRQNKRLN
jgi:hypothetical protein